MKKLLLNSFLAINFLNIANASDTPSESVEQLAQHTFWQTK